MRYIINIMNIRLLVGTVIAIIIIAALGAFVYFYQSQQSNEGQSSSGAGISVPDVNPVNKTNPFTNVKTNPFE